MKGRAALACLLVVLVATWPLVLDPLGTWPADPDGEVANHVWGLHTVFHEAMPLGGRTLAMNHPDGVAWIPIDPLHAPLYALGACLGGPVLGYNLVVLWGVLLMALAGLLLAREAGLGPRSQWIAAVIAGLCPQILATIPDGQSEAAGLGWVGVQLAFLLRFVRTGAPGDGLLAALTLAAAWYSGPYNGVFASLLDAGLGLGWLTLALRARIGRHGPSSTSPALRRALLAGIGAFLLVLPLLLTVLIERPEGMPGSASRAELPVARDQVEGFRGGIPWGSDLLDPLLPAPTTGHVSARSHTAYLGLSVLLLAALGLWRKPSRWPWALGAGAMTLLSLGPWISVAGRVLWTDSLALLAPAGVLSLGLPFLMRLTRWYRAGAVASLLLAPLAAGALDGRSTTRKLLATALIVVDCLLLSPLRWPLPHHPPPPVDALTSLPHEGALFLLPSSTFGDPPLGAYRDLDALLQVTHGRPTSGGLLGEEGWTPGSPELREMVALLRTGAIRPELISGLEARGFRYLVVHPAYREFGPWRRNLQRCFGGLVAEDAWTVVADLHNHDAEACSKPPG